MTVLTTAQSPSALFDTTRNTHNEQREMNSSIWPIPHNSVATGGTGVVRVREELPATPMSNFLTHNSSKQALLIEMGVPNEFRYPGLPQFNSFHIYFLLSKFSIIIITDSTIAAILQLYRSKSFE